MPQELASIDDRLLSPSYVESPYEVYKELRTDFPAYWCERWNAWLLTRYDDVQAVLQDFRRFSNKGRYTEFLSALSPLERSQVQYLEHHYQYGGLVQSDPPDHTRLRKLIGGAFTPRIANEMRELVGQIANDLIDRLVEDTDEVELIRNFAFPLPAIVIAGVLGVPAEERDQFKVWSSNVQRFLGSGAANLEYSLAAQEAWKCMNEYFADMLQQRRRSPREDLLSALASSYDQGEQLTTNEIVRTCGALLIAGHETTTNLISNGIWLLLRHPEQKMLLMQNPELYPTAIEEILRYESPFQTIPRSITEDVTFHGQLLRKGELVYGVLGAANRDPSQFDNPNKLDIQRRDNKHLAFGYGIHFCIGAGLARMEAPLAIQAILKRFPKLQLDENRPPVWKKSMVQRGMESFWLTTRASHPPAAI
jgi:cytochrome P450